MKLYSLALVACRSQVRGNAISKVPVCASGPMLSDDPEAVQAYANNRTLQQFPFSQGYTDHQMHVTVVPDEQVRAAARALGMVEADAALKAEAEAQALRAEVAELRGRLRRRSGFRREGLDCEAFEEVPV